ncbi:MAG: hypothetical protein H7Y32_06450, partial [Chloroflexales bacterium]|nr:hypothetical protein [Chloroflexales bacterium]
MARSLSNRIALTNRPATAALPRLGLRSPWPPLLLAVATLLCLLAAYGVRPSVQVDLGDYSDSAYLSGFNAREIDAVGASATLAWPAATNELTLPGNRGGVTIAQIAPAPAAQGSLAEVALAVNGVRVSIPRRPNGAIVAVIPANIAAAPVLA